MKCVQNLGLFAIHKLNGSQLLEGYSPRSNTLDIQCYIKSSPRTSYSYPLTGNNIHAAKLSKANTDITD